MTFKQTKDGSLVEADHLIGYMRDGFAFSVATALVNVGTAETPFLLINNVAGATLRDILFQSLTLGSDSSGSRLISRFYINPTVTANGTSLTVGNNNVGSANTSIATAFQQPTVSSNGTFIAMFLKGAAENSFIVQRNFMIQPTVSVLATLQPAQNNTPCHMSALWMELPRI